MAVAVRPADPPGDSEHERATAPPTVSARRHLRDGLPEVYHDPLDAFGRENFGMRFLQALEEVLDPVVATLDALPAHFDPALAPPHVLAGISGWLGLDEIAGLSEDQRRAALQKAGRLGRLRGTRAGLELALKLFFPGVGMEIIDNGKVTHELDPRAPVPSAPDATFDVRVLSPMDKEQQLVLHETIARWKPMHARYKLLFPKAEAPAAPGAPS